jgi:hypothetical protein
MQTERTKPITVKLDDQTTIQFESTISRGEQDISDKKIDMEYEKFSQSVEKIASQTIEPLKKLKAKKVTLKMGLALGLESGGLTAMIVKGTGKANMEVTIEWENEKK